MQQDTITGPDTGETTLDGLLNRRITVAQPAKGFRIAVDTLLLAAAVPALKGQTALDLGCGVGGALCCLGIRVPGMELTGIEIQPHMAALARANMERNSLTADICEGDAIALPEIFKERFDHVLINPPYHETTTHDVSDRSERRIANSEVKGDLPRWLKSAELALKPGGCLTIIHRADRLEDILMALQAFGAIEILPLLPKAGKPPSRVIVRAQKGTGRGRHTCAPLILHKETGGYTEAADAILRDAQDLKFMEQA